MKSKILIILLAGAMLAGCEVRELTTYKGASYVNFVKEIKDSITVSFMLNPGVDVVQVPYEIELVGIASSSDLKFKVVVDKELSTASADNYVIPEYFTFGAGKYKEVIYIGVKETGALATQNLRIFLRLTATDQLGVGKIEKSAAVIWLTNSVSKPSWWDWQYDTYYFGTYSNAKYTLMIRVCDGIWEFNTLQNDELRNYALKFAKYIKDNGPFFDDNNQLIDTPLTWI